MALFVVLVGFFLIYVGIPWLIARMFRALFREAGMRLKLQRILSFAIFWLAVWGVWELRDNPAFFFRADQIEKFHPGEHWDGRAWVANPPSPCFHINHGGGVYSTDSAGNPCSD